MLQEWQKNNCNLHFLYFCLHNLQLCAHLGNGIVSLILFIAIRNCKYLSNPNPYPPVGAPPNFLNSKYQRNSLPLGSFSFSFS